MQESTSFALHKLVFALDRAADVLLRAEFNISHSRALVLVILHDQPGITQHQLAQALGHTDPAVSAILSELAKDGYVISKVSEVHKRKKSVALTQEGKELARQTHTYLSQKFDALLEASGVDGRSYDRMTKQLYNTVTNTKDT